MSNEQRIQFVRDYKTQKLDPVSPTFCLAKWTQSTIYLWNGQTHSCHHPGTHKIPVEGLSENPTQLHNTPLKQQLRQQMLDGVQVSECEYCWNVETLDKDYFSDRHFKSAAQWSAPYINEVLQSGKGENFTPKYVEVAFETTCNFKCTYCFPHVSSRINEEIAVHGPYQLADGISIHNLDWLKQQGQYPISRHEHNPYVEAFWQWWPTLYQQVDVFRITGGEPLLSKHTWKVIDYIIENPRPGFDFALNTNFGIEGILVDKLIDKVQQMVALGVKVEIYTSLESFGPQAEYARFGLDIDLFQRNVDKFLTHAPEGVKLAFMTTINILSVTTFEQFLQYIFDLRVKYNKIDGRTRVGLSINYLRYPEFLALPNLPLEIKQQYADRWIAFVESRTRDNSPHPVARFYLEEINNLKRMCEWMISTDFWKSISKQHQLESFKMYHQQYDHRRGTNFTSTFPELAFMVVHDK